MTKLLTDLHLAEAFSYTGTSDSVAIKSSNSIESIYKHYDTDSVTVRKSLEYYAENPQILNKIYTNIDEHLKDMETTIMEVEDKKARDIFVRDSIASARSTDSLRRLRNDSLRYQTIKNLLFWESPDSTTLKPVEWDWKKELLPPKRYFNYTDSLFYKFDPSVQPTPLQQDSTQSAESQHQN